MRAAPAISSPRPVRRRHRRLRLLLAPPFLAVAASAAFLLFLPPVRAGAQTEPASPPPADAPLSAELLAVQSATVRVIATDAHGPLYTTGFFVDPRGGVLSVIPPSGPLLGLEIQRDGQSHPVRPLWRDPGTGLVFLRLDDLDEDETTPYLLPFANEVPAPEDELHVTGWSLHNILRTTSGRFIAFTASYKGRFLPTPHLQINLTGEDTEAGSPVTDSQGRVAGILLGSSGNNNGDALCLPMRAAQKVADDIRRYGRFQRCWLGLRADETPSTIPGAPPLLRVATVSPDGPAAVAGLLPGDFLLRIGSETLTGLGSLFHVTFHALADQPVEVGFLRDGQPGAVALTPVLRPEKPDFYIHLLVRPPDSTSDNGQLTVDNGKLKIGN